MKILNFFVASQVPFMFIFTNYVRANSRLETDPNGEISCLAGNSKSTHLIDALNLAKSNSELTKIVLENDAQIKKTTESGIICIDCMNDKYSGINKSFNREALDKLATYSSQGKSFNPVCMQAAAQFVAPGTPEAHCPESGNKSSSDSCVTTDLIEYQVKVTQQMHRCFLKHSSAPVSLSSLFEIHSIESAYKPNFSSSNGHGLGQVTNIFVKDAQSEFRGLAMLKRIAIDPSPECAAANKIATIDIKRNPILSTPRFRCEFIEIGKGMERNILYTLIGMNTFWKNDISPRFSTYSKTFGSHPDFPRLAEKLLQIGYGAGGPVAAKAIIKKGAHLSPDKFLKYLNSTIQDTTGDLNKYVRKIANRQKAIGEKITDPALKADFDTNGARACLN